MQALHDYIIENKKPFNEKFDAGNGVELYGDKRFLFAKLSNRVATVVNVPLIGETVLKVGYQVMIDPTIYYSQYYEKFGKGENGYLQDREKGLYKIEKSMIVLYRETFNDEWKGFGENLMVEFLRKKQEKTAVGLILETEKVEYVKGFGKIVYDNPTINKMGVSIGDTVAFKPEFGVSFYFGSKELFWLRNRDILAIANQN